MGFSSGDEDDSGDSDGSDMGGIAESDNMESDGSDSDSPVTFDDGLDENLIGDAEDRIRYVHKPPHGWTRCIDPTHGWTRCIDPPMVLMFGDCSIERCALEGIGYSWYM